MCDISRFAAVYTYKPFSMKLLDTIGALAAGYLRRAVNARLVWSLENAANRVMNTEEFLNRYRLGKEHYQLFKNRGEMVT